MDADGEDDPEALKELLNNEDYDVVHVVRGKRNEGFLFRISYLIYKFIFKIVTGKTLNFGNYCLMNRKVLEATIHNSFVHLAAYLSKQKIKTDRR